MKEKNFLFKLGTLLVPAVFASHSPDQALWIAFGSVLLLIAVPVLPKGTAKNAVEGPGFLQDFLQVLAAAFLAALADETARRFGVRTGLFFFVILVNAGWSFRYEDLQVKAKAALWFCFAFLGLSMLKLNGICPAFQDPFFIFSGTGGLLLMAGFALQRKWCVL